MNYQELQDEIKSAMKAKDKNRLSILRQVHGEIKNIEVNERREITDADVDAMLKRTIKQTKETLEGSIKAGNDQERTDRLTEQVEILEGYLPKQVSGDELIALIESVLSETGATTKKEMGKVMGALTQKTGGNFDKAAAANSQKIGATTYYATNLLVYGTEVAVIDVNEIAGSTYGASTLPATISGLTDVQWLNTRTNDTDEGAAYNGAIMQLSFYASQDGTLTLTNVSDIATNSIGTVTLTVKGGEYNKFDSLIVTGNVTATFTASGSTTLPTGEKITSLEFKPSWTFGDTSAANLDIVYENAVGKRPSYIIYKKGDSGKTNLVGSGSKFTAGTAFTLPSNNDAAAQTTTVTLAGADAGDYVLELTVGGATKTVEFTVAKAKISALGSLSGLPTATDAVATVNAPYTVTGATTGLNAVITVAEKTNNGSTAGTIETGDIATATLTITADANHVLDSTAPAASSVAASWVAGTHTATSWVYTLDITVS